MFKVEKAHKDFYINLNIIHTSIRIKASKEDLEDLKYQIEDALDKVKQPIQKEVEKHLKARSPVIIYKSTETGQALWAIALKSDKEFWIKSFKRLRNAIQFCQDHNLPYVVTSAKGEITDVTAEEYTLLLQDKHHVPTAD